MQQKVTRVVGGKPSATFYQQQAKFQEEVREYLETPIEIPDTRTHGDLVLELSAANAQGGSPYASMGSRVRAFALTNGQQTAAATVAGVYNSGGTNVTITANRLVLAAVNHLANSDRITACAIGALNFTKIASVSAGLATGPVPSLWRALTASPPAAAPFLMTSSTASDGSDIEWALIECDNVDTSGVNGAGAIVQSNSIPHVTSVFPVGFFSAGFTASLNATFAMFARTSTTANYNPGYGSHWRIVAAQNGGGPAQSVAAMFNQFYDPRPALLQDTAVSTAGIIAEIKASGAHRPWVSNVHTFGEVFTLDVPLAVGDRVRSVVVQGRHVGAAGTFSAKLWKTNKATLSVTQVGSTATSSAIATADEEITIPNIPSNEIVAADTAYTIEWSCNTGEADQRFYGASVTYDHPA